jgi:hypothetical protein
MHNVATSSRGPSESSLRVATHLAGVRRPDLAGGGTSKLVHLALHVTTCLAVARRKDEGMGMCMAAAHREYNLRRGSFLPTGILPFLHASGLGKTSFLVEVTISSVFLLFFINQLAMSSFSKVTPYLTKIETIINIPL